MKLLFTIDDAGSDILNDLLGFSDRDFKIEYLKNDLISATDELIEVIGKETYASIYELLDDQESDETDNELVYRARVAIAVNAYRSYAPDNDISHTSSGRKQRSEENERAPWQWQIDLSNKSLERKYYKAVDALLAFLDDHVASWRGTDAYKATHALFVRTTRDFDNYFNIGRSRLLLIKLMPGLRRAETTEIFPRIGKTLYDDLKAKLKASDPVDEVLLEKIKEVCVYKAMAWAMGRLSVQLFPEGVLQFRTSDRLSTQASAPALKSEPEAVAQKFEGDANKALKELEEMVAKINQVAQPYVPPALQFDDNDVFVTT